MSYYGPEIKPLVPSPGDVKRFRTILTNEATQAPQLVEKGVFTVPTIRGEVKFWTHSAIWSTAGEDRIELDPSALEPLTLIKARRTVPINLKEVHQVIAQGDFVLKEHHLLEGLDWAEMFRTEFEAFWRLRRGAEPQWKGLRIMLKGTYSRAGQEVTLLRFSDSRKDLTDADRLSRVIPGVAIRRNPETGLYQERATLELG